MKTVFSGIQPTGKVHLGNLLGAINNWVHLSNEENKNYFCVVDLHSLTTHPDPSLMQENINETIKKISEIIKTYKITTLLAPAYEGGHQDHDVANFIASRFRNCINVLEFSEYNYFNKI